MKIKTEYPILFDDTEIYYPSTFDIEEQVVEKVNQTEAGTDQIQLTRTGKIKMSFSTKCLADWLVIFKSFSALPSFVVSYYDVSEAGYIEKTVRMRNLKYSLVKNSYELDDIAGIYNVSFTLEEF